ncbi:hypothetical protein GWD52_20020 [Enterobacteriaceae bacterium 4M9]|nr:hypothetical protein [Enterobacteriaceae bacterium 4M9]
MSLIKLLTTIAIALAVSACSMTDSTLKPTRDNVVVIKLSTNHDAYAYSRLEQIIYENSDNGFTGATIFSDQENEDAAKEIVEIISKNYGIKSDLVLSNALAGIQIQLNKYSGKTCYVNQLDDFNWYKSTNQMILDYSQTEVCATSINDRLSRK